MLYYPLFNLIISYHLNARATSLPRRPNVPYSFLIKEENEPITAQTTHVSSCWKSQRKNSHIPIFANSLQRKDRVY